MPSRSATSRLNGAKSKGPKTAPGKAKSARNSLRHGLTSQSILSIEESSAFGHLRDAYVQQFQPAGQMETDLVEALAVTRLRLRRIARIEAGILANKQAALEAGSSHRQLESEERILAAVFEPCLPSIALLIRYENSLNRTFDRTLKQLQLLQKMRLAPPPQKLQNEPKLRISRPWPPPPNPSPQACPPQPAPVSLAERVWQMVSENLPTPPHPPQSPELAVPSDTLSDQLYAPEQ